MIEDAYQQYRDEISHSLLQQTQQDYEEQQPQFDTKPITSIDNPSTIAATQSSSLSSVATKRTNSSSSSSSAGGGKKRSSSAKTNSSSSDRWLSVESNDELAKRLRVEQLTYRRPNGRNELKTKQELDTAARLSFVRANWDVLLIAFKDADRDELRKV